MRSSARPMFVALAVCLAICAGTAADEPKKTTAHEAKETSEPRRLPARMREGAKSPELGALQRKYRKLLELGLVEEALEVASELGRPPEVVQALATESADKAKRAQSVVKASADGALLYFSEQPTDWNLVRDQKMSCDFRGASVAEIAAQFHRQTGLTIQLDAESAARTTPVHLVVRDRPAKEAIPLAFGAAGLACQFTNGRLTTTAPKPAK